jgi:serine protease Do
VKHYLTTLSHSYRIWPIFAGVGVTLMGLMLLAALAIAEPSGENIQTGDHHQALDTLRASSRAFSTIGKTVSPAVVSIRVEQTIRGLANNQRNPSNDPSELFGEDLARKFFGDQYEQYRKFHQSPQRPRERQVRGEGSGFLVSADGHILTNHHVVGNADKVTVHLHDGREMEASLIGSDKKSDVAVIKIDAKNMPFIPLADSEQLDVGEWVLAFGSPFGLTNSMTAGIVSAKGRTGVGIVDYENFIQTDAAINPGNSGGPLVNLDGEVVGINTAIASRSGGYQGIGFAIPINLARNIRDQLVNGGTVRRGFLGILIQPLSPDMAKAFGSTDTKGVLIGGVGDDSPAKKAGLLREDIIVQLDGKRVVHPGAFRNRVAMLAPGTEVQLTVLREGQRKQITVTLGELPTPEKQHAQNESGQEALEEETMENLGLAVQTLSPELAERLGYEEQPQGVVISKVARGSLAQSAGLRPGVLILEVNRQKVDTAEAFKQALDATRDDGIVLMLVQDQGSTRFITLKWKE